MSTPVIIALVGLVGTIVAALINKTGDSSKSSTGPPPVAIVPAMIASQTYFVPMQPLPDEPKRARRTSGWTKLCLVLLAVSVVWFLVEQIDPNSPGVASGASTSSSAPGTATTFLPLPPVDEPKSATANPSSTQSDDTVEIFNTFFQGARKAADAQAVSRDPQTLKDYWEFPLSWLGGESIQDENDFADKLDKPGATQFSPATYRKLCDLDEDANTVVVEVQVSYKNTRTGKSGTETDHYTVHVTEGSDHPLHIVSQKLGPC